MNLPQLSLVICTYNRVKFLPECLQHLSRQTIDADQWEVIIVDNHSTDNTAEVVKAFIKQHPQLPFRYVFEEQKGLSFARNRGLAEAMGDIITYIDDDAEAVPHFAETVLNFMLQHPEAAGVGGRVVPKYSECPEPEWMSKYLNGFVGRVDHGYPIRPFSGSMKYPIGCNMTYRKRLLESVGGFNNDLTFRGDDKYIYQAVSTVNSKVYYLPEAEVQHNIDAYRLTPESFRKLYQKTGNEERKRVAAEEGLSALIRKGLEYLLKFGASLLIGMMFTVTGNYLKGKYVMLSQWYTWQGFILREVHVR